MCVCVLFVQNVMTQKCFGMQFELVKNFDEEVTLGNPIGSGGFGTVYEVSAPFHNVLNC